jgi:hypothetical protein
LPARSLSSSPTSPQRKPPVHARFVAYPARSARHTTRPAAYPSHERDRRRIIAIAPGVGSVGQYDVKQQRRKVPGRASRLWSRESLLRFSRAPSGRSASWRSGSAPGSRRRRSWVLGCIPVGLAEFVPVLGWWRDAVGSRRRRRRPIESGVSLERSPSSGGAWCLLLECPRFPRSLGAKSCLPSRGEESLRSAPLSASKRRGES